MDDGAEEVVCTICAEAGENGDALTRLEPCGHVFHANCVVGWFRASNDSCPNCRSTGLVRRLEVKTVGQRIGEMRRKRRVTPEVRRALKRLDGYARRMKDLRKAEQKFAKENREVLKEYRRRRRLATGARWRHDRYRRYVGSSFASGSAVSMAAWRQWREEADGSEWSEEEEGEDS